MSKTPSRLLASLTLVSLTLAQPLATWAQAPQVPQVPQVFEQPEAPMPDVTVPALSDPPPPAPMPAPAVPLMPLSQDYGVPAPAPTPPAPPASPPRPQKVRVYAELRPHVGLIASGASLFGAFYMISALAGAMQQDACHGCSNPGWPLYVPVVGPFMKFNHATSEVERFGLIFDGLTQLGGAIMFFAGLKVKQKRWVYASSVQVAPTVGLNGSGLTVLGRF